MTFSEVMSTLESLGTEQNRKTYRRHGASGNPFGVSFANLEKLRKQIKKDQPLASQLWATGNYDARNLALLIADADAMNGKELDAWMSGIDNYAHADLFARFVVSKPELARNKMEKWVGSKKDFVGQTGFVTLALIAGQPNSLPDDFFAGYLETIERDIHRSGNRTKYAMNGAVIAIGLRNEKLRKLALAASARIGKVEVDHGDTNCKTPDAAAYIKKTLEFRRKKKNATA
jgi:3-methyladenine DNA glycosylase AlkD